MTNKESLYKIGQEVVCSITGRRGCVTYIKTYSCCRPDYDVNFDDGLEMQCIAEGYLNPIEPENQWNDYDPNVEPETNRWIEWSKEKATHDRPERTIKLTGGRGYSRLWGMVGAIAGTEWQWYQFKNWGQWRYCDAPDVNDTNVVDMAEPIETKENNTKKTIYTNKQKGGEYEIIADKISIRAEDYTKWDVDYESIIYRALSDGEVYARKRNDFFNNFEIKKD